MRCVRELTDVGDVQTREAETAAEQSALVDEALMLGEALHPGVVQLVGLDDPAPGHGARLRTRRPLGTSLSEIGPLDSEEVAGLGAALATTVGDLHALGLCLGGVRAEDVVVDVDGRPILVQLPRARYASTDEPTDGQGEDLTGLMDLVRTLAHRPGNDAPAALLRVLDPGRKGRRRRPRTVRDLARHLMEAVPGARLPASRREDRRSSPGHPSVPDERRDADVIVLRAPAGAQHPTGARHPSGVQPPTAAPAPAPSPDAPAPDSRRPDGRRGRRSPTLGLVAGLLVMAVVAFLLVRDGAGPAPAAVASCPTVDRSCRPVPLADAVLSLPTGRYTVGQPGDVVVLGRWACGPVALPALLSPGTGDVWLFDRWARSGVDVSGRLITHMTGARSLDVVPGADGCDTLDVLPAHGPAVPVATRAHR